MRKCPSSNIRTLQKSIRGLIRLGAWLSSSCLVYTAAANAFFDPTGTTLNATVASSSWEGNVWAPTGTPIASPTAFVDGSFVVFSVTGEGATAITITANANHNFAGIYNGG